MIGTLLNGILRVSRKFTGEQMWFLKEKTPIIALYCAKPVLVNTLIV